MWHSIAILLPQLKQRKGYIVNATSIAGFIGVIGMTDYSHSKYATIGYKEPNHEIEIEPLELSIFSKSTVTD